MQEVGFHIVFRAEGPRRSLGHGRTAFKEASPLVVT